MRVFSRCYARRRVLAPGCREFGAQVFEEMCVALLQVGMNNDTVAAKLAGMLFSRSLPSRTELASRVLMDGISSL